MCHNLQSIGGIAQFPFKIMGSGIKPITPNSLLSANRLNQRKRNQRTLRRRCYCRPFQPRPDYSGDSSLPSPSPRCKLRRAAAIPVERKAAKLLPGFCHRRPLSVSPCYFRRRDSLLWRSSLRNDGSRWRTHAGSLFFRVYSTPTIVSPLPATASLPSGRFIPFR